MGVPKRGILMRGYSSIEHLPSDYFEGQTVWFFESGVNEYDCKKGTIIKVYKKVADVEVYGEQMRISLQQLFTDYPIDKVEVWLLNTTLLYGLESTCRQVAEACRLTTEWPIRQIEEDAMEGGYEGRFYEQYPSHMRKLFGMLSYKIDGDTWICGPENECDTVIEAYNMRMGRSSSAGQAQ
jgi:hypothetical protein